MYAFGPWKSARSRRPSSWRRNGFWLSTWPTRAIRSSPASSVRSTITGTKTNPPPGSSSGTSVANGKCSIRNTILSASRVLYRSVRYSRIGGGQARNGVEGEDVVARPVLLQVPQPRLGLVDRRHLVLGDPPEHIAPLPLVLEPHAPLAQHPGVGRPVGELLQRLDRLPDREVEDDRLVLEDAHRGRVAAVVLEPPDEALGLVGEGVHHREALDELAHDRVVERPHFLRDVELGYVHAARRVSGAPSMRPAPSRARAGSRTSGTRGG